MGGPNSSLFDWDAAFELLCNSASGSPSLPKTRSAPRVTKFSTASVTTQWSAKT